MKAKQNRSGGSFWPGHIQFVQFDLDNPAPLVIGLSFGFASDLQNSINH